MVCNANPFQLTRSRGAWPNGQFNSTVYKISTHTLTWSVTNVWHKFWKRCKFQLTRSRGAWPYYRLKGEEIKNFNSHAHVERDSSFHVPLLYISAFQLTRSRGAWQGLCKFCVVHCQISTHTLTWSVTDILSECLNDGEDFNSHAHVERDITILLEDCQ